MRPSIDYIKTKFDEFNKLCFGGTLKPLPFRLSSARTFIGKVQFERKRNVYGKLHNQNFVFRISDLIDRPQEVIDDTILHGMIHYYILSNQIHDTSPHGVVFKKWMNEINAKYNRNITISHRLTQQEREGDDQIRRHFVCLVHFNDGQIGIAIPASTRLFQFYDQIPKIKGIVGWQWYGTHNPYFNRYKRSTTVIKVFKFSQEEFDKYLKNEVKLIKRGNTIGPE